VLGKIYTFLFIIMVLFAFWYQRQYLQESSQQFNAQRMAENSVLPASEAHLFFISVYEEGVLKSTFSGSHIVYYTDASFKAQKNVVYQEFNAKNQLVLSLKTEEAHGQMQLPSNPEALSPIKSLKIPGEVRFYYQGWSGIGHDVEMDGLTQTIRSQQPFLAQGPEGSLKGTGFVYDRKQDVFQILSNVQGRWMLKPNGVFP
jgi:lipopolysaccharide export system protein LptC